MIDLPKIDRETASSLNPFIAAVFTEDTLRIVAGALSDIGYLLSTDSDYPHAHLQPVFECIEIALRYEITNPVSCQQIKKGEAP